MLENLVMNLDLRDQRSFGKSLFLEYASSLTNSTVLIFNDLEDKLETFNSMLLECIERHAPLQN